MSTVVQIGSNSYNYPNQGETGGTWGEDSAAAFVALVNKVNNLSSNTDIPATTANLANNISSNTAISGLLFNSSIISSANITYFISRTAKETGQIQVYFDGSIWQLAHGPYSGEAGITFDINSSGQVVYQSSNDIAGTIKFFAKTIAV